MHFVSYPAIFLRNCKNSSLVHVGLTQHFFAWVKLLFADAFENQVGGFFGVLNIDLGFAEV